MPLPSRYVCTDLLATLSIILKHGLNPRFVKYSIFFLNDSTIVASFTSVTGVARIAFVVQSYSMKMVVIPSMDRSGNLPVKSVYIVPVLGSICPE